MFDSCNSMCSYIVFFSSKHVCPPMFHKVMFGVWNACRFLRDTLFAIFLSQHGEDRREDPGCQDTLMTAVEQIHMDKKDNHPWGTYMINKCIAFSHAKAIKSIDLARSSEKYPVTSYIFMCSSFSYIPRPDVLVSQANMNQNKKLFTQTASETVGTSMPT